MDRLKKLLGISPSNRPYSRYQDLRTLVRTLDTLAAMHKFFAGAVFILGMMFGIGGGPDGGLGGVGVSIGIVGGLVLWSIAVLLGGAGQALGALGDIADNSYRIAAATETVAEATDESTEQ